MTLIRYTYPNARSLGFSGRSPWSGLESEIGRLFDSALTGLAAATAPGEQLPVDLYEDKDNTYVRADLPGVSRDDINVEMVEDTLTIAAVRKQKTGGAEQSFSFSRSVRIPEHVQGDKVAASYENGVLTVTLPKREQAKPRKITVS